MRFYQIIQYGRIIATHPDKPYVTEEELKAVCNRIVTKAKQLVQDGKLRDMDFDVDVCDEQGNVLDSFICGTDYTY